jgi:hypothetical protein
VGPLPAHVIAEAKRGSVKIPKGPLSPQQAAKLVVDLRKSELRKARALAGAVAYYNRVRKVK